MESKFVKADIEQMFADLGITPKMVDEISIRSSPPIEHERAERNEGNGYRWEAKKLALFEISLGESGIKLFRSKDGVTKSFSLFLYSDLSNFYLDSSGFIEIQLKTDFK